jgi:hypothetical protein
MEKSNFRLFGFRASHGTGKPVKWVKDGNEGTYRKRKKH